MCIRDREYLNLQVFCALTGRVPVWTKAVADLPVNLPHVPLQFTLSEKAERASDNFDLTIAIPEISIAQRHKLWSEMDMESHGELNAAYMNKPYLRILKDINLIKSGLNPDPLIANETLDKLESVGRVIRSNVTWSDAIFSETLKDRLKAFSFEASHYLSLLKNEEFTRLFRKDASPSALFSGPPGTGKTLAAQCIASELNLPLLIVDIAKISSKYIGETSKKLSQVFECAKSSGTILFFDEADAFFAKRTELKDSHDRHANADTNHLLQLVEDYQGIVILASNKKGHLDEAFIRRIRQLISFDKPEANERLVLWQQYAAILIGEARCQELRSTFSLIAQHAELTPAQIKGAMLAGLFKSERSQTGFTELDIRHGLLSEYDKSGLRIPAWLKNLGEAALNV